MELPGATAKSAAAATALRDYTYTTVFLPEPGGGYTVFVPALPEVCGTGLTLAEAELAARESIGLALEVRREMGDSFPSDCADIPIRELSVALADAPA
jgi:antitoxin HicB